jgi:hypothetical protein
MLYYHQYHDFITPALNMVRLNRLIFSVLNLPRLLELRGKLNPLPHVIIDSGVYSLWGLIKRKEKTISDDDLIDWTENYTRTIKNFRGEWQGHFVFVEVDVGCLGKSANLTFKLRKQLEKVAAEIDEPLMVVWHGIDEPLEVLWSLADKYTHIGLGSASVRGLSIPRVVITTYFNLLSYPLVRKGVWVHLFRQATKENFLYCVATSTDSTTSIFQPANSFYLGQQHVLQFTHRPFAYHQKPDRFSLTGKAYKIVQGYNLFNLRETVSEHRRPILLRIWEDLYQKYCWDKEFKGEKEKLLEFAHWLTTTHFKQIFFDYDKAAKIMRMEEWTK